MESVWEGIRGWFGQNLSDMGLVKVYVACAVAGGTILLGQAGLSLFGLGGAEDIDADVDVDDLEGDADGLGLISIRTLSSFLTIFGLVGWGGTSSGWGTGWSVLAATASGSSVMLLVALMMRTFRRLASDGNVKPEQAIGKTGRVYLRIPGQRSGKGKVTVLVQGRSREFEAVTAGEELPTGSDCRIVEMITEDTFEVAALS